MKSRHSLGALVIGVALSCMPAKAQSVSTQREIAKAEQEIFLRAAKTIEENTDVKLAFEVDARSFGEDEKAWSNLAIIAQCIVAAVSEVGKDQVGKDALDRNIRKVVIMKAGALAGKDGAELNNGILTVKTAASDSAVSLLQSVLKEFLEEALPCGAAYSRKVAVTS